MPTLEDNRWTPVREGDTYCSPACGRGCTHKQYLDAQCEAQEIVDKLGPPTAGGRAWEKRVHENLGWHASARLIIGGKEVASVRLASLGYVAHVAESAFVAGGKTPREAVKNVLAKLAEEQDRLTRWRHALVDSLKRLNP